jgi:hypothetical protein
MKNLILFLPLVLAGCYTESQCSKMFPPTTKTETITNVIQRDSVIQGATITHTITNRDTIFMQTNRVFVKQDTSGRAELRYWMDEAGRLNMECTAKDAAIKWVERHVATNTTETRRQLDNIWWKVLAIIAGVFLGFFLFDRFNKGKA